MVKNVCNERKTIIPKPIIRLTSFDLIQTTIFLPRAKDYLTTFDRGTLAIRDLRLCARLAIGQRFLSREVAVESRGGRRSETPISRFPGPGVRQWYRFVERKWKWKWPVGVNSFLWSEYQRMRDLVYECVSGQADTRRLTRTTIRFFSLSFFSFFKVTPLVQSRNSIGNFLSPASLSPISVTPPHILPPSTPRIRSNYVGRKYVRSKSLFPAFGRLPRICSLTVHLDKMPPFCHRNETERERDMHFA